MDALGWDSCDIVIVTGDAYVDHPSFGMAVIGRVLEAQGFRVGIIAQPDWQSAEPLQGAGQAEPVLRRHRRQHGFDDQPLHGRPQDRAATTPTPRATWPASGPTARRWSTRSAAARPSTTCRSCSAASKAACAASRTTTTGRTRCGARSWSTARPTCCCTATPSAPSSRSRTGWRGASRWSSITDVRGTAFMRRSGDPTAEGWFEIDSTEVDQPGRIDEHINPYQTTASRPHAQGASCAKEEGAAPRGRRAASRSPSSPTARPSWSADSSCRRASAR